MTQVEGTSAVLTCLARGDPVPNMTLYRLTSHGPMQRVRAVCIRRNALLLIIYVTYSSSKATVITTSRLRFDGRSTVIRLRGQL